MTGVAMQLAAAANRADSANENEGTVKLLSSLSTQVQRALVEVRRSVSAMRTTPDAPLPLHEQLGNAARRAFAETAINARVEHTGSPRTYSPRMESQVVSIAAEAMANALRHAECRTIVITCLYAPRDVRVTVRDDGCGFDPARATPAGHWGLVGMRERAASIGATLAVRSAPGAGTEVLLIARDGAGDKRAGNPDLTTRRP